MRSAPPFTQPPPPFQVQVEDYPVELDLLRHAGCAARHRGKLGRPPAIAPFHQSRTHVGSSQVRCVDAFTLFLGIAGKKALGPRLVCVMSGTETKHA